MTGKLAQPRQWYGMADATRCLRKLLNFAGSASCAADSQTSAAQEQFGSVSFRAKLMYALMRRGERQEVCGERVSCPGVVAGGGASKQRRAGGRAMSFVPKAVCKQAKPRQTRPNHARSVEKPVVSRQRPKKHDPKGFAPSLLFVSTKLLRGYDLQESAQQKPDMAITVTAYHRWRNCTIVVVQEGEVRWFACSSRLPLLSRYCKPDSYLCGV